MGKYFIDVVETRSRTIEIEADNYSEAEALVEKAYYDGDFNLDSNDFVDECTEFEDSTSYYNNRPKEYLPEFYHINLENVRTLKKGDKVSIKIENLYYQLRSLKYGKISIRNARASGAPLFKCCLLNSEGRVAYTDGEIVFVYAVNKDSITFVNLNMHGVVYFELSLNEAKLSVERECLNGKI